MHLVVGARRPRECPWVAARAAWDVRAAAGFEDTELGCFWNWRVGMERRKFSREFKLEAVKLVSERGVGFAQAARDLDLHVNVLRKWVREQAADPRQAFPGKGQMRPEQLEIEKLRREVAKLKAERDILKKSRGLFREGLDMKFGFVAKHRVIWPVS